MECNEISISSYDSVNRIKDWLTYGSSQNMVLVAVNTKTQKNKEKMLVNYYLTLFHINKKSIEMKAFVHFLLLV